MKVRKTVFKIPGMDCPSEERIIRMKLDELPSIQALEFDIPGRTLAVFHDQNPELILEKLVPLNFGAALIETVSAESPSPQDTSSEGNVLKLLFAINFAMFVVELSAGVIADSMGLLSDSFDMLADASVYLISLYAVGKGARERKLSARTNGLLQIAIGSGILVETVRRFIYGSDPEPAWMIVISLIALAANVYCLILLTPQKEKGEHLKASYICSSTDVMANTGVIVAGILVSLTGSQYPDLLIGIIVTAIVLRGALSILALARN